MTPEEKPPYSLTRRMGAMFALTTCTLVALYAIWSAWVIFHKISNDTLVFLDHEVSELAYAIQQSDGSLEEIQSAVHDILQVTKSPGCAFRIRDAKAAVIHEQGDRLLLLAVTRPVDAKTTVGDFLWDIKVAVGAVPVEGQDLTAEIIVDVAPAMAQIGNYLASSLMAFLVAVGLAGVAGWFVAQRGLASLRDVVAQAESADPVAHPATIELADAPAEVREVGRALNAMLVRIHGGLTEMRTFTAGLAHELRSPLQNLIGEVEVALMSDRTSEEYQRVLRSNLEDLTDLTDAVDNLVAFCRTAEPSTLSSHRETFDLAQEAELRLQRESRTAQRTGITIAYDFEGDTRLHADREGTLRVLRNLVRNALYWSPEGSTVTVRISGHDGIVKVVVEDEGPGVPVDLRSRIFEPFVSGRPNNERRGGYGLGLAICRSVMDEHHGRLAYESRDEGGARFIADFPVRSQAA